MMTQHAGELALTQALLDRPAFDYCFCTKASTKCFLLGVGGALEVAAARQLGRPC